MAFVGVIVGVIVADSPNVTVTDVGVTVRPVTSVLTTDTVAVALMDVTAVLVAVIVTVPTATPVTTPLALTEATKAFDDVQVNPVWFTFVGVNVGIRVVVEPIPTLYVVGENAIAVGFTFGAGTVTVYVAVRFCCIFDLAVIIAVP